MRPPAEAGEWAAENTAAPAVLEKSCRSSASRTISSTLACHHAGAAQRSGGGDGDAVRLGVLNIMRDARIREGRRLALKTPPSTSSRTAGSWWVPLFLPGKCWSNNQSLTTKYLLTFFT